MKYHIFIILILFQVNMTLFAQDQIWEQYTNCVNISNQSLDDNFNWIATHSGIVKANLQTNETEFFNNSNSQLPQTSNNNYSVLIDQDGLKWIRSRKQLICFNDTDWFIYDFNNSPLLDEDIVSIKLDTDNSIWITYYHTLIKFDNENWEVYTHNDFGFSNYLIANFAIDENGYKWFTLYNENYYSHLIRFDNVNWSSITYGFPNSFMKYIITDSENFKWFAAYQFIGYDWYGNPIFHHRLANYDGNSWVVFDEYNSGYPADADYSSCVLDGNTIIWFGTDEGLLKFDSSNFIIYNSENSELPENDVISLVIDNSGLLWVGTRTSGMASFNDYDWEIFNSDNSNYPVGWLRSIKKDISGKLWIAVSSRLSKFDGTDFESIAISNSGLTTNNLTCLDIGLDGTKWIGTWCSNLHSFNGNEWICYNTENSGLPYHNIRCVEVDENDDKWIGTSFGLAIFNDNEWTVYNTSNSGLPENDINKIAFGLNGIVWIGTYNDGLVKYDGENWTVYNTDNSNLPHNKIQSLTIDDEDLLWIGTRENFASFDGENWIVYDLLSLGYSFNSVADIAIEENGDKWIVVYAEGLIHYDGVNWELFNSINSELPSNPKVITIDASNAKWIGTSNGLAKFEEGIWTIYSIINSGLSDDDIIEICIDENNTKWIATDGGGLSVFNENGIPVSIENNEIVNASENFSLQNYPNPFNPSTTISFETSNLNENTQIEIYNIKGQKVKQLVNDRLSAGQHSIVWDGKDSNDKQVGSGIYFYKLNINGRAEAVKKCLLLK